MASSSRAKGNRTSVPRAALAQLGKLTDPEIAAQHGIPVSLVRAERIVRGIKRAQRGGRPPKAGVAQTERLGLTMTRPEIDEITAAVPQGQTRGRWVVEAALMRARVGTACDDPEFKED